MEWFPQRLSEGAIMCGEVTVWLFKVITSASSLFHSFAVYVRTVMKWTSRCFSIYVLGKVVWRCQFGRVLHQHVYISSILHYIQSIVTKTRHTRTHRSTCHTAEILLQLHHLVAIQLTGPHKARYLTSSKGTCSKNISLWSWMLIVGNISLADLTVLPGS